MLARLRIIALSVMWGLVVLAFVLYFALSGTDGAYDAPPLTALVVVPLAGALAHGVLEAIGYRVPALEVDQDVAELMRLSGLRYTSALVRRLVLCELIAFASLVGAFLVDDGGFVVYAVGAATSLALLSVHGWPSERSIARVQAGLEQREVTSHLRAQLAAPAESA